MLNKYWLNAGMDAENMERYLLLFELRRFAKKRQGMNQNKKLCHGVSRREQLMIQFMINSHHTQHESRA
jgi:hypothetical protein